MKKVLLVLLILLLCGCSNKSYKEISYDELNNKLSNNENFVFVVGQESCHNCVSFKVVMDKIIKEENIKVYYVDSAKLKDNEELVLTNQFFADRGQIYTPVMFVIEGGHLKSKQVGYKNYSVTKEFLIDNGIVRE